MGIAFLPFGMTRVTSDVIVASDICSTYFSIRLDCWLGSAVEFQARR